MKTLICINSQQAFLPVEKASAGVPVFFHSVEPDEIDDFSYLYDAAKKAEKYDCELLIDASGITGNFEQSVLNLLELALQMDHSWDLVCVAQKENEDLMQSDEYRIFTILQLLVGEKVYGFRNSFRVYPVKLLNHLSLNKFKDPYFHINIIIKASISGYRIRYLQSNAEFRKLLPIPGISFIAMKLLLALLPLPNKRLCERNFKFEKFKEFLAHPLKFLKFLLKENATPGALAAASATGMFIGTLPIFGLHTALIIYFSIKLRLNKILSVNISHLCMPPFLPFACIELGYYMRHGTWLKTGDFQTIIKELHLRLLDWGLGALILAPLNAIVFASITYFTARFFMRNSNKKTNSSITP